ncbi:SCO family protein [Streptomyces sp. NPDC050560]|uniref:SCO family protein n=1 Tax=Streptomyces sp. NPDC050560 TaxID=3365630 RepID=UPI00378AC275
MRKKTLTAGLLLAAAALTLTACGGGNGDDDGSAPAKVETTTRQRPVTVLDQPYTKPDLVLTDTHGRKYDLRKETAGHPTLIYFGYTHCPDVCPLTMSNIAVAKQALPKAEQDELRVVFVTTDPARDTPKEMGAWLKAQDAGFIGLTGDFSTIQAAARSLAISVEPTKKDKNGKLVSTHGTQVIAFSPKSNTGYLLYDEDATADDYTKDLPKIVKGEKP